MKRLIALVLVVAVLTVGFTALATPIGVGGYERSAHKVFPGKGDPQGKPFAPDVQLMSAPIGVGGYE